jgi:hypothetical protein
LTARRPRGTAAFLAAMLLLFTVLTAVMTFPQVLHLRDGVHDDGDPLLVTWVLAWVAHQLPLAPAHIFDANMFYPERNTLAYSETMLVPGIVVAPLHWLGVHPILVYNLVFLSGFALSGVGVALLVRRLTGNSAAAILAGIIFAFPPYRIDHYAHLQLQQTQFIPLALWAFHRLLDTARVRDGVLVGMFAACQMLSCMYYGIFLVPYMAVVCGTLLVARVARDGKDEVRSKKFEDFTAEPAELAEEIPSAGSTASAVKGSYFILHTSYLRRLLTALTVAGAVAGVVMIPAGRAYLAARAVVGERGPGEVAENSATWRNYLAPPEVNAVYGKVFARFMQPERRLFPGFVAIALAAVGLFPSASSTRSRFRGYFSTPQAAYALGLVLAFDVSLGFNGVIYRALYDYFLPFKALRIPARMGLMVSFSLAILAGYGATRIASHIRSAPRRRLALASLGVLLLVEYASMPLPLWIAPRNPPETYADLLKDRGDSPTAVVFEFPTTALDDPAYLYFSTFHWQTLINGYSGFFPPSYRRLVTAVQNFPDQASIDAIKAHGARYLVVHGERLYGGRYEQLLPMLDARPDLTLVSRRAAQREDKHSEISLYRISLLTSN